MNFNIYHMNNDTEYKEFLKIFDHVYETREVKEYKRKMNYAVVGAGFDIETTNIDKLAFMYHWQFSFNENVILGRTWEQFEKFFNTLLAYLDKNNMQLILWVANLGFEFQFLRTRFPFTGVFATSQRNPIKAYCGNVEFRDCLMLTGQGGIKNLAKMYCSDDNQKMSGDLDYKKRRNSTTPLTEKEEKYCINDVTILSEFGLKMFDQFDKIPLTKTGIVRKMVLDNAKATEDIKKVYNRTQRLYPSTANIYNFEMRYLFRGGVTHANFWNTDEVINNVFGVDFTSSYPAVMLHNSYPVNPFREINDLRYNNDDIIDKRFHMNNAFIMIIKFNKISNRSNHTIESKHKIITHKNAYFDNGRLLCADEIVVELNEVDYAIYKMFYQWENMQVLKCKMSLDKKTLPKYVIDVLMTCYITKQRLKIAGNDGTIEYKNAKSNVNSMYGMTVTRLVMNEIKYDDDKLWYVDTDNTVSYAKLIQTQVLSPYWGIWVTSYARYQLCSVINMIDPDTNINNVIYYDTDSIYMIDNKRNRNIINEFNAGILKLNKETLPIEFSDIGAFDEIFFKNDKKAGGYKFKTLGAKRYVKYKNGVSETVVAGLVKDSFEKSIESPDRTLNCFRHGNGFIDIDYMFKKFDNMYVLGVRESEKTTHHYNDEPTTCEVQDEYGVIETMSETSSIAIYEIPFQIRIDDKYLLLIKSAQDKKRKEVF